MPGLLAADDTEAVLNYLGTLKLPKAVAKPKKIGHVNAARGSELSHTMGCVACHAPGKDFTPPDGMPKAEEFTHRSVAFPNLAEKHVLSSLAEFIREPLKTRADGRMPRIAMDEQDAVDIAGYLLNYEGSDGQIAPKIPAFTVDKALAERGRGIVASRRDGVSVLYRIDDPCIAALLDRGRCLAEDAAQRGASSSARRA